MYELENGKDQSTTVREPGAGESGLVGETTSMFQPPLPMRASHRLLPFFWLPGRVTEGKQTVWVERRPFNDRQLNRDLRAVCEQVTTAHPRLPDGRRWCLTLAGTPSHCLAGQ